MKKVLLYMMILILCSSFAFADLDNGTISYYKSDTLGSFPDSLGLYNGVITSATFTNNGKIQGAYNYTQGIDYVSIPNPIVPIGDKTISLWFKMDSNSSVNQVILSNSNVGLGSSDTGFSLFTTNYNDLGFLIGNGGDSGHFLIGTIDANISIGTWYFLTYIQNNNKASFYLNGVNLSFITSTSGTEKLGNTTYVARRKQGGTLWFGGLVDEIGFWNRSLNSTEVSLLYNGGVGIQYPFNNAPIFVYPTPIDAQRNNTNVTINVSCNAANVYLYFDNETNPSTLVLTNSSSGEWTTNVIVSDTYYYKASCWNETIGFSENSSIRSWIYDITSPNIIINSNNGFQLNGYSNQNQYSNFLNINMTFRDNADLFGYNINITKNGISLYDELNETINGTEFNLSKQIDISSFPSGLLNIQVLVSDSHTQNVIKPYINSKRTNGLDFLTTEKNQISITSLDSSIASTKKSKDRYSFDFEFNDFETKERTFILESNNIIKYRPNSPYKAHFIIKNNKGGNWIDFEGLEGKPIITKLTDYAYSITFENIGKEAHFNSLGGVNVEELNFTWYRGTANYNNDATFVNELSTFYLNMSFNSTALNDINANLYYNGVLKTGTTKSTSATRYDFSNSFISTINGTFPFYWDITIEQANTSTYSFNLSNNHTVYNISIGTCTALRPYKILNISYLDQITNAPITATNGYNLNFYTGQQTINSIGNFSGNLTDHICINIDPAISVVNLLYYGSYQLEKTSYASKIFQFPFSLGVQVSNNPSTIQKLYMIPIANSSTITYNWQTTQFQLINGLMLIYECNTDGTKTLIDSIQIADGFSSANLQLFHTPYSYEVLINGIRYIDDSFTTCHVENVNERTFYVPIDSSNITNVIGLFFVDCTLEKIAANIVKMTWNANPKDSSSITGCIVAERETIQGKVEVYRNCTSGTTGSFIRTITPDGNSYYVKGEITQGQTTAACQDTITFFTESSTSEKLGLNGILAIVLLIMSCALLFAGNGELAIGGAVLGILISYFLGILSMGWETITALTCFLVIIAIIGRYSKKRQEE